MGLGFASGVIIRIWIRVEVGLMIGGYGLFGIGDGSRGGRDGMRADLRLGLVIGYRRILDARTMLTHPSTS